jgi:hypothetical protein
MTLALNSAIYGHVLHFAKMFSRTGHTNQPLLCYHSAPHAISDGTGGMAIYVLL